MAPPGRVEIALLPWVRWYNARRPHSARPGVPPAEDAAAHPAARTEPAG